MKKIYQIFLYCLILIPLPVFSQITLGETDDSDSDAVLDLRSEGNKGLILPKLSLIDLYKPDPLTKHVPGMVIYNMSEEAGTPAKGHYFNDGTRWVLIADTHVTSWFDSETNKGATSTSIDLYQTGGVVTGSSEIDAHTKLGVYSGDKGVLFPKLSSSGIDGITNSTENPIPDGLLVFNLNTKCFSYFNKDAEKWVSLCPEGNPSSISIESCTGSTHWPTTPEAYRVGVPLTNAYYYTLTVRVTETGPYSLLVNSQNGYSFYRSGNFTETGLFTLTLPGQGTPQEAGTDVLKVYLNNVDITDQLTSDLTGCPLPSIEVASATVGYTVLCVNNAGTANGEYVLNNSVANSNNYYETQIRTTQTGNGQITTDVVNGIYFQSDPINLTTLEEVQTIKLYAKGTPTAIGEQTLTIYNAAGHSSGCSFSANVITNLGRFDSPAQNCLEIYNQGLTIDGEYWVRQSASSTLAVKTLCDMTNGGYTLISSFSEGTAYNGGTSGGNSTLYLPSGQIALTTQHHLDKNFPSNVVTATSDAINYNDFRLSLATMKNIRSNGNYRVMITYDPEALMEDKWAQSMHLYVTPPSGFDFINNGYASNGFEKYPATGKFFNIPIEVTSSGTVSFNGETAKGYHNWWNSTYYSTHIDFGYSFSTATDQTQFTTKLHKHPDEGGEEYEYTFDTRGFNNMFGWFGEFTGNHQFGKCLGRTSEGGTSPDYGHLQSYDLTYYRCQGAATSSTVDRLRPHSFNNGEGRYLQWWVK